MTTEADLKRDQEMAAWALITIVPIEMMEAVKAEVDRRTDLFRATYHERPVSSVSSSWNPETAAITSVYQDIQSERWPT